MRVRVSHRPPTLAAGIALALTLSAAAPSFAMMPPRVVAGVGQTFLATAAPVQGGFAASLALEWPPDWRFGDHLFAGFEIAGEDLGAIVGQIHDQHDNELLGATQLGQRAVYSASFRADLEGRRTRLRAIPFVNGSWGLARVDDARLATRLSSVGTTGFSLGGGLRWPAGHTGSLGVSVRYRRWFNDVIGRYMSVALDWGWRAGR